MYSFYKWYKEYKYQKKNQNCLIFDPFKKIKNCQKVCKPIFFEKIVSYKFVNDRL